jgi:hypothetical protein
MPRLRGGGATDTLQLRLLDREQRVETLYVLRSSKLNTLN